MKTQLVKRQDRFDLYNESDGSKIASTLKNPMGKLSLKNCKAIENGYDLDELADYHFGIVGSEGISSTHSFKVGFQKALELLGNKKFSEEDVISMIKKSREKTPYNFDGKSTEYKFSEDELIQSLQQTEWDVIVEIEKEVGTKLYDDGREFFMIDGTKPKLDSNGCLILKRK